MPRAIGMFGHSLNPEYFINPPGFTYLLHGAFWVRWGGREALGDAFAADPGSVFELARVLSAVLGAAAVGFLVWAGRRLFDLRVGLVAGALLAVAFLPVHYSHLAVNDVPALAPLCLSLVGIAGVYRRGRLADYALAGAALGVACATKYTAGIVLLCLLAAARENRLARADARRRAGRRRVPRRQPVRAARPRRVPRRAGRAVAGVERRRRQARPGRRQRPPLLPRDADLGARLAARHRRRRRAPSGCGCATGGWRSCSCPRRSSSCSSWAPRTASSRAGCCRSTRCCACSPRGRRSRPPRACGRAGAWAVAAVAALLCVQGLVFSIHNDVVLARDDTRALARAWMVENIPEGDRVVIEPIAPDQWAMDTGRPSAATGTGNRWNKWPTSRFRGQVVKLEDFERTLRTSLLDRYARAGYCHVVTARPSTAAR